MTLKTLIKVADTGYPEHAIIRAHQGEEVDDTLAKFIAIELPDTFDENAGDEEQFYTAMDAIEMAIREMEGVFHALEAKMMETT